MDIFMKCGLKGKCIIIVSKIKKKRDMQSKRRHVTFQ